MKLTSKTRRNYEMFYTRNYFLYLIESKNIYLHLSLTYYFIILFRIKKKKNILVLQLFLKISRNEGIMK